MSVVDNEYIKLRGNYMAILCRKKIKQTYAITCKKNTKVVFLFINNTTCSFTDKINKIEQIYKYFHHLRSESENIYVITTKPVMCCKEIKTNGDFLKYIYTIPFVYNRGTHLNNKLEAMIEWIEKTVISIKKNSISQVHFHIFDDSEEIRAICSDKIKKICNVIKYFNRSSTTNIDYDTPNIFTSTNSQLLFKVRNDNIIFDNDMTEYDGILNGNNTILIGKIINDDNKLELCNDVFQILNIIYNVYLIYYGQENNKGIIYNFLIPFFEEQIKYIQNNQREPFVNTITNIIRERIYYYKATQNTNIEEVDNFLSKLIIGHIPHKKFIRMMSNFSQNKYFIDFRENIDQIIDTVLEKTQNMEEIDDSLNTFYSTHSMTNWLDELEEKSCTGIIINIFVPNYCRLGKKIENIKINHVTQTFMSVSDYVTTLCSPENKAFTGDLNNTLVVNDPMLGSGNCILPLFINKWHWKIASCYVPIIFGIGISNNIMLYTESMDLIYYLVLSNITSQMFCNQCVNIQLIRIWTSILRTSMEISIKKRFHKGFANHIISLIKIGKYNEYNMLFGQMMSVGFEINNEFFDIIKIILLNKIKQTIKNLSNLNVLKNMIIDNDVMINDEINIIIMKLGMDDFKSNAIATIKTLLTIYQFKKKCGSFVKLIELIDSKSGILDDEKEEYIMKISKMDMNNNEMIMKISDIFSFENLKENIISQIKNATI